MWFNETVFYQIYPLGFCGAPLQNDGVQENRISKLSGWIPHLKKLGAGALLLNPLFESDAHGYDTRDMTLVDTRLGTNEDFAKVCREYQQAGIRVVLDGVFNHVGRGFWAFKDVCENKHSSRYQNWFHLDYNRNSNYNDGFWYEGWEGHYELVKLNLHNPELVEYLLSCVKGWVEEFGIDGIRLDVAYCLDHDFMRRLRSFVNTLKPEFFLVGEMLHGDYKSIANPEMLDSATNYECYKGLYSSLNSLNMFEIAHSFIRQFGPEDWTLYKGMHLFNFIDNHDVTRAASVLENPQHLPLLFGMMIGMPGIPCVYYGSEWGAQGKKENGNDIPVRASFDQPVENQVFATVSAMVDAHNKSKALQYGAYRQIYLTNKQFIFERKTENQRVLVVVNAEDAAHTAHFNAECGMAVDLITKNKVDFGGGLDMPACSIMLLEMEK